MAARARSLNRAYAYGSIILGLAVFVLLWLVARMQPYIAWLAGWTVATFLLYGLDKVQAQRHGWRVPEMWLHTMSLLGGFLGGWAGMLFFRHKTQKPVFKVVLAVATLLHAILFYLLILRS